MAASLTLNKITAQKDMAAGEAADGVADLGWTSSYVREAMTFPTVIGSPRSPAIQWSRASLLFPMQEEKDNGVYGALDAALRAICPQ